MSALARDGLPARASGAWTREKLTYLSKYAGGFMTAMAPKRREGKWERLVYIDLLAGPGVCVDERGEEFEGSPLIALGANPRFDHLFLGDLTPDNIASLNQRISPEDRSRTSVSRGDCNLTVREVVDQVSAKTLGLAFVDPEGLEVRFETLRLLASRRVDLLYLFPSGIGIRRNLARFAQQSQSPMDDFWGDRSWRELPLAKRALGKLTSREELQLDRDWVSSFRKRVSSLGLCFHDTSDPEIRNDQNTTMYHLLFFSHDSAGLKIWKGIKRIAPSGQRELFRK